MPTEPLKSLLDRESSIKKAKPLIDIASPLLMEVVNYSTKVPQHGNNTMNVSAREGVLHLRVYD